jgi:5,10-methylenetetrahydromethanopterin reductase
MRIGIGLGIAGGQPTLAELLAEALRAERAGFASVWMPNLTRGFDALSVLLLAGRQTSRIELGSFVIPTYPRHPAALAQQALTVQAAIAGRLVLGIGLSHQVVIETSLGLDYSRPIVHMREYLTVLNALLAGEPVAFEGELYRVTTQVVIPGATKPPVIVAALGPAMLRLAGRLADGTATWMGGLVYLRDVAVPAIRAAAAAAGRPAPRVVAGLPVCVTDDPDAARKAADSLFERYGQLPSYRATLDRGGAAGPGDVAVVGNERAVAAQVRALADAGVTDFNAAVFPAPGGDPNRTYDLLAHLAAGAVTA